MIELSNSFKKYTFTGNASESYFMRSRRNQVEFQCCGKAPTDNFAIAALEDSLQRQLYHQGIELPDTCVLFPSDRMPAYMMAHCEQSVLTKSRSVFGLSMKVAREQLSLTLPSELCSDSAVCARRTYVALHELAHVISFQRASNTYRSVANAVSQDDSKKILDHPGILHWLDYVYCEHLSDGAALLYMLSNYEDRSGYDINFTAMNWRASTTFSTLAKTPLFATIHEAFASNPKTNMDLVTCWDKAAEAAKSKDFHISHIALTLLAVKTLIDPRILSCTSADVRRYAKATHRKWLASQMRFGARLFSAYSVLRSAASSVLAVEGKTVPWQQVAMYLNQNSEVHEIVNKPLEPLARSWPVAQGARLAILNR